MNQLGTTDAPATERRHASGVYKVRDTTLVRGSGARLWDAEGREYVDCAAGHGVTCLGHAHPRLTAALADQASRLVSCPGSFASDRRAEYLELLAAATPAGLDRFFLCNSGTEAVEAALKLARQATGRTGIVATLRGFHGRTIGALSATWEKRYRRPFEPLVPGFEHVPFGNLERAVEKVDQDTAAFLVEPIQGEGGVHVADGAYLRRLRELCRDRGALLVVDEVQTGFGRTGRLFACEHHDLVPDLLCLGKGIAGGFPMGAVALGPRVEAAPVGSHGSTFGGNPLACAAAGTILEVIREEDLCERVASHGAWLRDRLERIDSPWICEVRGQGLMLGLELRTRVRPVLDRLFDRGVIALAAGSTVLRLLPPLVIDRDELERAVRAIEETLAELER